MRLVVKKSEILQTFVSADILSHYTKMSIAQNYILDKGTLKFSSMLKQYDPFEYKDIEITYGGMKQRHSTDKEEQKAEESIRAIRRINRSYKIACFCKNKKSSSNIIKNYEYYGFARPRMWAQYSELHKGCCLIFSRKVIFDNIRMKGFNFFRRGIRYYDSYRLNMMYPNGSYDGIREYGFEKYSKLAIRAYRNNYLFVKHKDFVQENEYRIALQCEKKGNVYIPVKNAIVGIVISDKVKTQDYKGIYEYSTKNKIPLFEISWDYRYIDLELINMDY